VYLSKLAAAMPSGTPCAPQHKRPDRWHVDIENEH
jgi:hypothetical protein